MSDLNCMCGREEFDENEIQMSGDCGDGNMYMFLICKVCDRFQRFEWNSDGEKVDGWFGEPGSGAEYIKSRQGEI